MIEEVFYSCNENYDKLQWNMKTCNQKIKSLLIIDQPTIHLGSIYYSLSTPRDTMGDSINSSPYQISNIWSAWVLLPVFSTFIATQCCLCRNVFILFRTRKTPSLANRNKVAMPYHIKLSSMRESCSGEIRSRLSPGSKLDSISVQNRLVFHQPLMLP